MFKVKRRLSKLSKNKQPDLAVSQQSLPVQHPAILSPPLHSGSDVSSLQSSNAALRSCLRASESSGGSHDASSARDSHIQQKQPLQSAEDQSGLIYGRPRNANGSSQHSGDSSSGRLRKVRFRHVQVREFERIIGDNPSCSSGAPVALGWAHSRDRTMRLDDYESVRPSRRSQLDLILTRQDREELLLEWGSTFQQIIDAIRSNIRVKNQRRRTVNNIGTYDRWEEAMENAGRKIKRTLLLKKSTKQRVEEMTAQSNTIRVVSQHEVQGNRNASEVNAITPRRRHSEDDSEKSPQLTSQSDISSNVDPAMILEPEDAAFLVGVEEGKSLGGSSFLSVDSNRPTSVIEVGIVERTTLTEDFYSYMEEMTATSGLTGISGATHEDQFSNDGFEMLDRDNSFWEVDEDRSDFPRIRRMVTPMVISEDGAAFDVLNQYEQWDSNGGFSGAQQPPPYSNSIINKWE